MRASCVTACPVQMDSVVSKEGSSQGLAPGSSSQLAPAFAALWIPATSAGMTVAFGARVPSLVATSATARTPRQIMNETQASAAYGPSARFEVAA